MHCMGKCPRTIQKLQAIIFYLLYSHNTRLVKIKVSKLFQSFVCYPINIHTDEFQLLLFKPHLLSSLCVAASVNRICRDNMTFTK